MNRCLPPNGCGVGTSPRTLRANTPDFIQPTVDQQSFSSKHYVPKEPTSWYSHAPRYGGWIITNDSAIISTIDIVSFIARTTFASSMLYARRVEEAKLT